MGSSAVATTLASNTLPGLPPRGPAGTGVARQTTTFAGGAPSRGHTSAQGVHMQTPDYAQVPEGMDVLDRDGDSIGKAGETLGNYFNVDAGSLGTKE